MIFTSFIGIIKALEISIFYDGSMIISSFRVNVFCLCGDFY